MAKDQLYKPAGLCYDHVGGKLGLLIEVTAGIVFTIFVYFKAVISHRRLTDRNDGLSRHLE